MLEGLDQLDWKILQHGYGNAENTPDMLRLLVSTDEVDRHRAHEHLVGAVNHQGTFYSVTAVIVPFLIKLLEDESVPQRDWILSYLRSLVTSCNEHLLFAAPHAGEFPLGRFRNEIDTYNQVCQGIDHYLLLLSHAQPDVRLEAGKLLGLITDQCDRSLEPLWALVETESDADVLAVVLNSFAKLATQTKLSDARWSRLHQIALNHDDTSVRWEAVLACIELTMSSRHTFEISEAQKQIPSVLIEMLVDGLVNPQKYNQERLASPERQLHILRMLGIEGMTRALKYGELNAAAAHLIVREMLDTAFDNRVSKFRQQSYQRTWNNFQTTSFFAPSFKVEYQLPRHHDFYISGRALKWQQKQVIAAVIDCAPFWKIESNLLSFFFGLPDDHQQLARFLED